MIPQETTARDPKGVVLVFISAMLWSTAGLFTRVVSTDLATTLFWRSLAGGLCLLAIYWFAFGARRKAVFAFSRGEVVIAVVSTLAMFFFIAAFFRTSIANVTFVYGALPLVTYLMALAVLRERLSLLPALCCLAATSGVVLMAVGNTRFDDLVGIGLAFGMVVLWATATVAVKFFPEADAAKSGYLAALLSALLTFPLSSAASTGAVDLIWLALYGITNIGIGLWLYLLALRRMSVVAAAVISLAEIPLAPIWAWLLFGEAINLTVIAGGAIIFLASAVYLIGTGRK